MEASRMTRERMKPGRHFFLRKPHCRFARKVVDVHNKVNWYCAHTVISIFGTEYLI